MFKQVEVASRSLDLSALPSALGQETAMLLTLQLKSILDRIDIPPILLVPDAVMMKGKDHKRWTIPNTAITIKRIETGPRAGEYLFSAATVENIPRFYEQIKHLPYKPGSAEGWFEFYRVSGSGLIHVIPYKWFESLPAWARLIVLDQPVWKWLGLVVCLVSALFICLLIEKIIFNLAFRKMDAVDPAKRARFAWLIALIILLPFLDHILSVNLRFIGPTLNALKLTLDGFYYSILAYAVWLLGSLIPDLVSSHQKLITGSIDSQLLYLINRLVTLCIAIYILVYGAQRLGFHAYSIFAGLGISGIAIAFAAQESLSNLMGSMVIFFEKPFRLGHWIKVKGIEGTIENIGFRSVRIRTFYNSMVTIPSSVIIKETIDNFQERQYRRVRTILGINYDTAPDKIEKLVKGIKDIIELNAHTRKDYYHVVFNDFGEYSLEVLIYFFLEVPDWATELEQRQQIFLEILHLANAEGIKIAYPTETLHIESIPENLNTKSP